METTDSELLLILRNIAKAQMEAELTARITGENFNVFSILNLTTNEVRTHSAFLAALLDPFGTHGQGPLYLRLFLSETGIIKDEFDPELAQVQVEIDVGRIDNDGSNGGRIDILLTDSKKRHIMIENKIYAADQHNQLLRYHNFDPAGCLLYLTLFGDAPSQFATANKPFEFRCISYYAHVLNWLNECYKNSAGLPNVRETIFQYRTLICRLTGLTVRRQIMENAKKIISDNPDLVESVVCLSDAWNSIVEETKTKFLNLLRTAIVKSYNTANNEFLIGVTVGEDGDGLYVGVNLKNNSDKKKVSEEVEKMYKAVFKEITKSTRSSPPWHIGWFNPSPFKHRESFKSLPRSVVLSCYKYEAELNQLVAHVVGQVDKLVTALIYA